MVTDDPALGLQYQVVLGHVPEISLEHQLSYHHCEVI
jgi:hypothetical protein